METPPQQPLLTLEKFEGLDQFTPHERHILSLLLIQKIQYGIVTRIEKICIKELLDNYGNTETNINLFNHFTMYDSTRLGFSELITNVALSMGISQERLKDFIVANEDRY